MFGQSRMLGATLTFRRKLHCSAKVSAQHSSVSTNICCRQFRIHIATSLAFELSFFFVIAMDVTEIIECKINFSIPCSFSMHTLFQEKNQPAVRKTKTLCFLYMANIPCLAECRRNPWDHACAHPTCGCNFILCENN